MAGPPSSVATPVRTDTPVLGGASAAATIVPTSRTDSDRDGTGAIQVKTATTGTVHLVLDVSGYFQ